MVEVGTGWSGWSGAQSDDRCLPLLIFPCTIKSRSSLLAPAHPGGPGKRAVKRLWLWCGTMIIVIIISFKLRDDRQRERLKTLSNCCGVTMNDDVKSLSSFTIKSITRSDESSIATSHACNTHTQHIMTTIRHHDDHVTTTNMSP